MKLSISSRDPCFSLVSWKSSHRTQKSIICISTTCSKSGHCHRPSVILNACSSSFWQLPKLKPKAKTIRLDSNTCIEARKYLFRPPRIHCFSSFWSDVFHRPNESLVFFEENCSGALEESFCSCRPLSSRIFLISVKHLLSRFVSRKVNLIFIKRRTSKLCGLRNPKLF